MKAVANIIQERRLLEEVRNDMLSQLTVPLTLRHYTADRPPVRRQPAVRLPGRRELLFCPRPHARRRPALCVPLLPWALKLPCLTLF